jgi:hypothetical protein
LRVDDDISDPKYQMQRAAVNPKGDDSHDAIAEFADGRIFAWKADVSPLSLPAGWQTLRVVSIPNLVDITMDRHHPPIGG